jgi:hypothetical protein
VLAGKRSSGRRTRQGKRTGDIGAPLRTRERGLGTRLTLPQH